MAMTQITNSIIVFPALETPSKRLANLFKQIVRENDMRDRQAAAKRQQQLKYRGTPDGRPQ
jgi:hypothetical protein